VFDTYKYSYFPHERLLVSRKVELPTFRFQTTWLYLGIFSLVGETVIPTCPGSQSLDCKRWMNLGQIKVEFLVGELQIARPTPRNPLCMYKFINSDPLEKECELGPLLQK
jgi:hypothetical protein